MEKQICKHCGREYESTNEGRSYCFDCNAKRLKVGKFSRSIKCYRCGERFFAVGKVGSHPKCPKCRNEIESLSQNKSLAEWIREAAECNLDYGTYRALISTGKTFEELKSIAHMRHLPCHSHASKRQSSGAGDGY